LYKGDVIVSAAFWKQLFAGEKLIQYTQMG
jgi:hypothetical protein